MKELFIAVLKFDDAKDDNINNYTLAWAWVSATKEKIENAYKKPPYAKVVCFVHLSINDLLKSLIKEIF